MNGPVNSKLSMRSRMPPWPGMRVPDSLVPAPTLEERFHKVAELRYYRNAKTDDSGKNWAKREWGELCVERRDHDRDERAAKRAFQGLARTEMLEDAAAARCSSLQDTLPYRRPT